MHTGALRRALEDCDVAAARALWGQLAPGMPQPESEQHALAAIHYARTTMASIRLRRRAYSHRWLLDHGLPSGLPDDLKPRAERLYPRIVDAVGISANFRSPLLRPAQPIVQGAMSDAVEECYAEGRPEPGFVKARMIDAKDRTIRHLFGSLLRLKNDTRARPRGEE